MNKIILGFSVMLSSMLAMGSTLYSENNVQKIDTSYKKFVQEMYDETDNSEVSMKIAEMVIERDSHKWFEVRMKKYPNNKPDFCEAAKRNDVYGVLGCK
ncbi:hypothetical protein [Pseudogulbenkiania subflava]|uniref:hypothetical protein n=1 Tax=Pseudogulbenkiania subflava TaxID=451637 RepID=UPI00117A1D6A|nr:hypothetical protein [Pseudogulbenkiania subflava]